MIRSRFLPEMLELGRGELLPTETALLVGGSLLLEAASRVPSLGDWLALKNGDTLQQLPERLASRPQYQLLAEHLKDALSHRGADRLLNQLQFMGTQVLNEYPQDQVWAEAGVLFSDLLSRSLASPQSGSFALSEAVADFMAATLVLKPGIRVFDPAARGGELLVAVGKRMLAQGIKPEEVTLHGHEAHPSSAALGQLNLLLNQQLQATLLAVDALTDSEFPLARYDAVLCLPPIGSDRTPNVERDPRFYRSAKSGRIRAEWAYLQVGLASLKPGGRAVFLLPAGALFRGGSEAYLRRQLAEEGVVTAAVSLPAGLLSGTGLSTALLVLDLPQRGEPGSSTVRLVDATEAGERVRAQRQLGVQDLASLLQAIQGDAQPPVALLDVPLAEQAQRDFSWFMKEYQRQEIQVESLSEVQRYLPSAILKARQAEDRTAEAMQALQAVLAAEQQTL